MKRFLSLVLTLIFVLSFTSFNVFADVQISDINSGWYWPVHSSQNNLYSPYGGWRNNFTDLHQGIDICGGNDLSIYASRTGDVAFKGENNTYYGNYICLYHGEWNGYKIYSTYMHLAEPAYFNVGQTVQGGQLIGKMGNTGSASTGTHLHFQIFKTKGYATSENISHKNEEQLDANYINTNPSEATIRDWELINNHPERFNNGSHPSCKYGTIAYMKVGVTSNIGTQKTPTHTPHIDCKKYATINENGKILLGTCTTCHTEYDWLSKIQIITKQKATLKSSKKNYKVTLCKKPYEDAEKLVSGKVLKDLPIIGTVKNAYGSDWYAVDYQDNKNNVNWTGYIYSKTLTDNYDITATETKNSSGNTSTKKHTHNFNYDNGRCYCGEKKTSVQQTPAESTLKINLTKYPSQHTQGNNFGLRGTISSNYKIKKIYGYIKQNGNVLQSTEDTPNAKTVDVKELRLNNNLIFNTLTPGSYTLEVSSVDAAGKTKKVSKDFTVVGKAEKVKSTLSINLEQYPATLTVNSGFGLRGTIKSNYKISSVKGTVVDSSGKTRLSSSDKPNSKSMDIKTSALNNSLTFNTLPAGKYTLKVVAKDASGKTVENLKDFTVVAKTEKVKSTLSINLEQYPTTLTVKSSFGLRGTVKSNYKISSVKGTVVDSNGKKHLSSSDTPNSKTMDIKTSALNNSLTFNTLPAGKYTLKVVAVDASGRTAEASKTFAVKAKESQSSSSKNEKTVSGTVNIPSSWTDLSIRSGPSTDYKIVGSMKNGAKCTVYTDRTQNGWYYVEYKGIKGYASGKQIKLNTSSSKAQTKNTRVGIVNIPSSWENLSIRSGPSTDYKIVGSMNQGVRCTVYPDKASNGWYYVEYNGVRGYAAGNRISIQ